MCLNSSWKMYESGPLFLQYHIEIRKYWKWKNLARRNGILSFTLLCNRRWPRVTSDLGFPTGKNRTAVIFVITDRRDWFYSMSDWWLSVFQSLPGWTRVEVKIIQAYSWRLESCFLSKINIFLKFFFFKRSWTNSTFSFTSLYLNMTKSNTGKWGIP